MSETPKNCSVCGTAVAPGAVRCVACGAVFGEDNRCPHCHALAAVQATSDGRYACLACGKP
ncbi:MAG: zinc ribbon domain-containing protein, partial [Myxococcales bacterium]|nr:zinc ribbon domain-containing protein [Myxococcales bacterium]